MNRTRNRIHRTEPCFFRVLDGFIFGSLLLLGHWFGVRLGSESENMHPYYRQGPRTVNENFHVNVKKIIFNTFEQRVYIT